MPAIDDPAAQALMADIEADLAVKVEFCRTFGLSANATVIAATKKDGLEEVKGLEVWYIEKFLASDAKAAPIASARLAVLRPKQWRLAATYFGRRVQHSVERRKA